jgi:TPP-dependent pyruvate/acetoin dehydrogenase alpha subunit
VKDNLTTMGNRKKEQAEPKTGATPPEDSKFSLISNQKLIALYTNLLKCRRGGESNGNFAVMRGREASVVGTAIDLGNGDLVCSHQHGLLAGIADGTIEKLLLAGSHRGPETSANHGAARNGPSPLSSAAAHTTQAAIGTALSNKTAKNGKVAVVFVEEQEQLREALHVATVHALPMIFVHQPHGKREKTRRESRRSNGSDSSSEETPWFPNITVDGNDVVAIYRVANEAISRARLGRGPTLIECRPFRVSSKPGRNGGHSHDPVRNMEHYLRARGLFDPRLKN